MSVSAYKSLFFDGTNHEAANLVGDFCTKMHSEKIKAGNQLEVFISEDIQEHTSLHCYSRINIEDAVILPCFITSCRFKKEQYEKYGLVCKNKKAIEVDLVVIDTENNISIIEVKNGCNFDTKKSKGEVDSLKNTRDLCCKLGYNPINCAICCYDAKEIGDMKLKTIMGDVSLILYKQLAEICGLDGWWSRERINHKVRLQTTERLRMLDEFVKGYEALKSTV